MNKIELTKEQIKALEGVKQRFSSWRETRTGRARIPDSLWSEAIDLFYSFGLSVNRIARSLRLNHTTLKIRITENPPDTIRAVEDAPAIFVELESPHVYSDCIIEMEKRSGVKMRLRFQGRADPAVLDLGRCFLEGLP